MALPYDMIGGYDFRGMPDWIKKAATNPDAEYADWLAERDRINAAARKPWEDARDKARSDEINAAYDQYVKNRVAAGYPAQPGIADNTRWVNDAGAYKGNGQYAAATPGNAWQDYVNLGRQDYRRLARQDMELPYDPRVADAEFRGTNPETQTPYAYNRYGKPLPLGVGGKPIDVVSPAVQTPREIPSQIDESAAPMPFRAGDMFGGATYDNPGRPGAASQDLQALLAALKRLQLRSGGISPYNAPWSR